MLHEKTLNGENIDNWASLLRSLLFKLGFGEVWIAQGVPDVNLFLKICKQRLQDQFIQGWFGELETKADTELYRHVKSRFSYSFYLDVVNIPRYRYSMCKFVGAIINFL